MPQEKKKKAREQQAAMLDVSTGIPAFDRVQTSRVFPLKIFELTRISYT